MVNLIELTIHPMLAVSTNPGMLSVEDIYARIGLAPPLRAGHGDIKRSAGGWNMRVTEGSKLVYVEPTLPRNEETFAKLWFDCLGAALRTAQWTREQTLRGEGDAQLLQNRAPVPLWNGELRDYVLLGNLEKLVEAETPINFDSVEHMSWGQGWAVIATDDLLARLQLKAGEADVLVYRVPPHLRGKPVFIE